MVSDLTDYVLKFKARRASLFFSEFVSRFYASNEYIIVNTDKESTSYVSRRAIERAHQYGKKFFATPDRINNSIKKLELFFKKLEYLIGLHKKSRIVTYVDCAKVFKLVENIHKEYRRFDFIYTDGIPATDATYRQSIAVVEKNKNKIRERYNSLFFVYMGGFVDFLQVIARQYNVALKDLCWCSISEVQNIIRGGKIPYVKIGERRKCFVLEKDKTGKLILLQGINAIRYAKKFISQTTVTDVIKGVVAYRTQHKIRGKVVIINSDYFHKKKVMQKMMNMNKGDVLVSSTTAPDLMIALKKAAAIITDVGGRLSHAAIVSRELKIPCVIGTKIATQVLKDGDMVEVDSINGTVRKIS